MIDPFQVLFVLDAHPHPDVRSPIEQGVEFFESFRALREDLVLVPVRLVHDREDALDVLDRDVLVEEVAHTVHEHASW